MKQLYRQEFGDGSTRRVLRLDDLETDPPSFRLSIDSAGEAAQSVTLPVQSLAHLAVLAAAAANPATGSTTSNTSAQINVTTETP